ncbi:sugar transporter ERD6-like 10 [Nicotiana sylvestris]|nr:PREDICTED: sugar transporter ERD6-like 10 [Nicotiana tabacum]
MLRKLPVGIGFLCKDYDQMSQFSATLVVTGILVFSTIFYSMGVVGAAMAIISEIFPMNIKVSAVSLAFRCVLHVHNLCRVDDSICCKDSTRDQRSDV